MNILITSVTVNGENLVLVAAKYGVCYSLSAAALVVGLHLCNPSAFRKKKTKTMTEMFSGISENKTNR